MRVFRFSCLFLFVSCTAKNPPVEERNNLTLSRAAIATGAFQLRLIGDTPAVVLNGTDEGTPPDCTPLGDEWTAAPGGEQTCVNTTCLKNGNNPPCPIILTQSSCTDRGGVFQVDANAASNSPDPMGTCSLNRSSFIADTAPGSSAGSARVTDRPLGPQPDPSLDPQPDPTDPNSVGTGKTPDPSPHSDIPDPTDPNSVGTGKTPQ